MSETAAFGINGRFWTQPVTGVQRYARNVAAAMNDALADKLSVAPMVVPSGTADPKLSAMPLIVEGSFTGHVWEQVILPMRWHGRLLNLCNLAPAVKADQVVCIHDANVFIAPGSYGLAFRAAYRALQPLLARRSARIVSVSADSARQIARHLPLRAADIVVLPNGHEHALTWDPALAHVGPAVVAAAGQADDYKFVLALGSRARHKNLQLLLKAASGLADLGVDVLIAGGDAGIFAPEALRSAPNVKVIGYVTDHDLAFLMERALCLAFPSWTEGFGLPIVEAMARGCAVVSSDRASMPEVCGDAALMASPNDPLAWIGHVRSLVESPELRQDLAGRGRERSRLFSWSDTAAGYIELMREPSARRPFPARSGQQLPNLVVVVATRGRAEILSATLRHLIESQSLKPTGVIISCVVPEDAGDAAHLPGVTVIAGRAGLAAQRNAALAALPAGTDIVVFFDDDFVADEGWLAAAARTFREEPEIVGFTGWVLADGIKGPGLSFDQAVRIIESADSEFDRTYIEPYSPYGCNMAFRMSAIGSLRFDERLVLYGWLEDRDFSAALAKGGGRLVKCTAARGVHTGVKVGRVSGYRLGYSQVINPVYLLRKGTMTTGQVIDHLFRNITSNVARAVRPEPFIDRRGRLRGNLRGLADILRGRLEPERASAIGTRER